MFSNKVNLFACGALLGVVGFSVGSHYRGVLFPNHKLIPTNTRLLEEKLSEYVGNAVVIEDATITNFRLVDHNEPRIHPQELILEVSDYSGKLNIHLLGDKLFNRNNIPTIGDTVTIVGIVQPHSKLSADDSFNFSTLESTQQDGGPAFWPTLITFRDGTSYIKHTGNMQVLSPIDNQDNN